MPQVRVVPGILTKTHLVDDLQVAIVEVDLEPTDGPIGDDVSLLDEELRNQICESDTLDAAVALVRVLKSESTTCPVMTATLAGTLFDYFDAVALMTTGGTMYVVIAGGELDLLELEVGHTFNVKDVREGEWYCKDPNYCRARS